MIIIYYVRRRQDTMESNVMESAANSDSGDNVNNPGIDIRSQLMKAMESQWAKASSVSLEKKKNKGKKSKGSKKSGSANNRNFRSVDMLNECVLEDQMVVDEKSEIIKSKRKMKIDSFTNDYEKIMNEKGHCKDDGKLDGSYKAHYRRFFMCFDTVMDGNSDKNYFDIEEHKLFIQNNTENKHWFCDRELIMAYFSEVVAYLVNVEPLNVKKAKHVIQKIIDVELHNAVRKRHTDNHLSLTNDVDFKTHLKGVWQLHKSNFVQFKKDKNETQLEPSDLMMKETSRKDLIKIVTSWLNKNNNKKGANESELEIMFMLIYDFKSVIRCDSCKRFIMKCKMMIQEEEDPCFQGLMVLPATEKVKDNSCYPSCTIRDVNFRICGQFFLSFLSLYKFQIHGTGICFLNQRATELVGKMHWGNMKLISKTKGASVSTKTKNVIVDGNVDSSKVTHQRNSGIVHLTKRTEKNEASLIFPEGIKGVSRHDNSAKAFSRYQS